MELNLILVFLGELICVLFLIGAIRSKREQTQQIFMSFFLISFGILFTVMGIYSIRSDIIFIIITGTLLTGIGFIALLLGMFTMWLFWKYDNKTEAQHETNDTRTD